MNELYELPEGWEWKKLKDTIEFSNKTVIIDNDDEYNCIGLEHIESNTGKLIDFKTSHGLDIKSSKVVFEKGMVLYSKLRPYLNKVWKAEFSGIATTEILPFKPFPDVLDSNYLAHYLRSNYFVQNAMNNISGARMPRITTRYLKNDALIPLPPLQEQKRIVAKLDALFEKIDKAIALHQKNMDEADAFMGSVLNDVFGELKEQYSPMKRFDTYTSLSRGHNPPKKDFIYEKKDGYVRFIQIRDGSSDKNVVYVPITKKLHLVTKNDLLLVAYRQVGKVFRNMEGAFNVALCKIVNNDKSSLDTTYLYYLIQSKYVKDELLKRSERALIPSMSIEHLKSIKIPIPPLKIQQKTVNYLDKISLHVKRVKELQKEKMQHLKALKASILDQAFRGKLN